MRKLLNKYNASVKSIHRFFGYEGDWKVYPIEDNTDYYWFINHGRVCFYQNMEQYDKILKEYTDILENSEDEFGEKQEFELSELSGYFENWVVYVDGKERIFEKDKYTAIIVDTQTDGNEFFSIWDNSKKIIPPIKEHFSKPPTGWIGNYDPNFIYPVENNGGSVVENLMDESEVNDILKLLNNGENINSTTE